MNSGLLFLVISSCISTFAWANTEPAKITLGPRNQYVLQNTKATFVCETSGQPLPEVTWLRNRRKILPGRRKFRIINSPNRSILRVIPSGRRDMNITCKANNGVGRPVIRSAMLKNLEAVPSGFPSITVHPNMRALFEGRDTVMICSADGYPPPTITWLKDDLPVDMGNPRLSMLPTGVLSGGNKSRLTSRVSNIGSLHIGKVEEGDEGSYECVASNSVGTAYSEAANLFVRVQDLPPTFYTEPRSEDVPMGGSVNLTCAAAGRPTPEIVWRQDDKELQSTFVSEDGTHILQLENVEETKNFTCFAFSKMGFAVSTVMVQAINASAPRVTVPPRNLRLTLEERQPPKVRVEWDSSPMAARLLNGHIVQYLKRGPASGDIREAFVPVGSTTFLTSRLDYESLYEFSVTPMWSDPTKRPLDSVSSTIVTPTEVTTTEQPLLSPRNLSLDDYDCTTGVAILSWDVPDNESLVDILYYELWQYNGDQADMTKVESSEYAVVGLSAEEEYRFSVRAVDLRGAGQASQNVTLDKCAEDLEETEAPPTVTEDDKPETEVEKEFAPKDIRIRRLSDTSIEVSWVNPDEKDPEKVQGYKILYRVHGKNQDPANWLSKDVGPNAMAILNNLTRDNIYEIRLQAKNREGYGEVSEAILSPKTSSQVSVGMMFGRPSMLGTRARIICTIRLKLPQVVAPGTAKAFSVVVVAKSSAGVGEEPPYNAGIFPVLPPMFELGDGKMYGDAYNRPLEIGREYRVYVKAYTDKQGYYLVSEESDVISTRRCQTNILTQSSPRPASHHILVLVSWLLVLAYTTGFGT